MKKLIHLFIALGVLVPVFAAAPVLAVDEAADTPVSSTTEAKEALKEKIRQRKEAAEKTLQERLEQRKAKLAERLTAADSTRLKSRCKAAQAILEGVMTRIDTIKEKRGEVYSSLQERLDTLAANLESQGVDTTVLKTQLAELDTKIDSFQSDLDAFGLAVNDMVAMDCESDPEAFKAALETARELRQTVATGAADIRTYLTDTVKPTLQEIKRQLEGEAGSDAEGSN